MLLEYSLGMRGEAELITRAVESVIHEGYRTRDLGTGAGAKLVGCKAMGRLVRERVESLDGES
jgi:isocitrate/isopropylmalate dehydrogenase